MQSQEHEKAFEKSLNYLAQRHGIRQVFEEAKAKFFPDSVQLSLFDE